MLGLYCTLSLIYSSLLKGIVLFDAVALAGLYTPRIVTGAAAVDVPLRGYEVQDLRIPQSLGGAAGYLSVLVLALYRRPKIIRTLCVLMLCCIGHM